MGYSITSDYAVVCDLGVQHFDSPRVGVAMARAAYAEMRRLGTADARVRSTRWRRRNRLTVELAITVRAHDPQHAFEVAGALLRTGIHAVGGSTAGWEQLRPEVQVLEAATRGRRTRRRARAVETTRAVESICLPAPAGWDAWSAAAQQRMERAPALPPMSSCFGSRGPQVIDLR